MISKANKSTWLSINIYKKIKKTIWHPYSQNFPEIKRG